MEFKQFYIVKRSQTYAEALEAFGVARFVYKLSGRLDIEELEVTIRNKGGYYLVEMEEVIDESELKNINYFPLFPFIKKERQQEIPEGLPQSKVHDYQILKEHYNQFKEKRDKIYEEENDPKKRNRALHKLTEEFRSAKTQKIPANYDVISELTGNPYRSLFTSKMNLFGLIYDQQEDFHKLLYAILYYYSQFSIEDFLHQYLKELGKNFKLKSQFAATQLLNPHMGKGLNRIKSNNIRPQTPNVDWLSQTMKVIGSLKTLTRRNIKVGEKWDSKIFVPEYNDITIERQRQLYTEFKKVLPGNSPVKTDILTLLRYIRMFIENSPEYRGKIKNTINGFYSTYLKQLSQFNSAVVNINFLELPEYIEVRDKEEGQDWIQVIEEMYNNIKTLNEERGALEPLKYFRSYLSGGDLSNFFDFNYWYGGFLMNQLSNGDYVRFFSTKNLKKLITMQNPKLSEIVSNEGFLAVASAIRKSTVSLQYQKSKTQKKPRYEIQYGLAQKLKIKSRSAEDLATFIAQFAADYNAETGRVKEKLKGEQKVRKTLKDQELDQFFQLLDNHSSQLVGGLLAAYGFALEKKDEYEQEESEESAIQTEE